VTHLGENTAAAIKFASAGCWELQRRPLLGVAFLPVLLVLLPVLLGRLASLTLLGPLKFVCNGFVSTIRLSLFCRLSSLAVLCFGDSKVNRADVAGISPRRRCGGI
jgi:hypothetical protein